MTKEGDNIATDAEPNKDEALATGLDDLKELAGKLMKEGRITPWDIFKMIDEDGDGFPSLAEIWKHRVIITLFGLVGGFVYILGLLTADPDAVTGFVWDHWRALAVSGIAFGIGLFTGWAYGPPKFIREKMLK